MYLWDLRGEKDVIIRKKVDMVNQGDTRSGTKIVKKNLRGGQNIIHFGDVILIGNLHAGAEIVAGGQRYCIWKMPRDC